MKQGKPGCCEVRKTDRVACFMKNPCGVVTVGFLRIRIFNVYFQVFLYNIL